MKDPIAVLAGTPVDTQMGADLLSHTGRIAFPCPIAGDPLSQTAFQLSAPEEKARTVEGILRSAHSRGCSAALIYCNSLAGAVDFPELEARTGIPCVTPLDVYRELAVQYNCLGVVSANAQGLSGIERTLFEANPSLRLYGACCLDAVLSIEQRDPPALIVEQMGLVCLEEWFRHCGAEAFLLGCTHFPYIKEALRARTSLPLLDPAERMLSLLEARAPR